jgi:hypothetical protein
MVNKKSRFNKKKQMGGNTCNTTATVNNPSCLPTPNVEMYKYPCNNLTENQFGMPGMGSISLSGGRRSRRQKGGSCAGPTADCLGSNYDNLGKTAISDGAPNDLPSSSELSWFFRNTYGATPSTNVVPQSNINNTCVQNGGRSRKQKGGNCLTCDIPVQNGGKRSRNKKVQNGGNVSLDLNDKIGGLSRVNNCYDPYPPSLENVKISGPGPQDVSVSNVISYNTRLNGATAEPLLEQSSLTRNSFQLVGGGNKKKNFLTRNSRHYLFGGSTDSQFPNVYNGVQSNFSPDMLSRKFDCAQPAWCPACT